MGGWPRGERNEVQQLNDVSLEAKLITRMLAEMGFYFISISMLYSTKETFYCYISSHGGIIKRNQICKKKK